MNVIGETVHGQEQFVFAFGIAHKTAAQMVFGAIGLESDAFFGAKTSMFSGFRQKQKIRLRTFDGDGDIAPKRVAADHQRSMSDLSVARSPQHQELSQKLARCVGHLAPTLGD